MNPWSFKKLYLGVFACDVCLVNWPKDMGMVISWLELEVFLALELDIWTTVPSSKTFSSCEDEDVCWVSTFGCCWDTAVSDDAEKSNSCQTSESLIVCYFVWMFFNECQSTFLLLWEIIGEDLRCVMKKWWKGLWSEKSSL